MELAHTISQRPDIRRLPFVLFVKMQLMQNAVQNRRQQQGSRADKNNAGIQSVERCEDLSGRPLESADGAHSSEEHRCIQESIEPFLWDKKMKPDGSDRERKQESQDGEPSMFRNSTNE